MKFNFKESPLYDFIPKVAGFVKKEVDSEEYNLFIEELILALDKSEDYEGDLSDLIEDLFDILHWVSDLIPALESSKWDDIILNLLEYFTNVIIDRFDQNKGLKFRDRVALKIKARRKQRKNKKL